MHRVEDRASQSILDRLARNRRPGRAEEGPASPAIRLEDNLPAGVHDGAVLLFTGLETAMGLLLGRSGLLIQLPGGQVGPARSQHEPGVNEAPQPRMLYRPGVL